jgi:hypothetical protein
LIPFPANLRRVVRKGTFAIGMPPVGGPIKQIVLAEVIRGMVKLRKKAISAF